MNAPKDHYQRYHSTPCAKRYFLQAMVRFRTQPGAKLAAGGGVDQSQESAKREGAAEIQVLRGPVRHAEVDCQGG